MSVKDNQGDIEAAIKLLGENGYIIKKPDHTYYAEHVYKKWFDMTLRDYLSHYLPKGKVTRIVNTLNWYGYTGNYFVGQIVGRPREMYEGFPNFGKSSMHDLQRSLFRNALHFGMNTKGWEPPELPEEPKRERSELPDSYWQDYIKRFMPSARFPMNAAANILRYYTENWPIMNDTRTPAMVLMTTGMNDHDVVRYIGIGTDIREYPCGLTTHEFKCLLNENWKNVPGKVIIGTKLGEMHGIKSLSSVRPQAMQGGWDANEMALFI